MATVVALLFTILPSSISLRPIICGNEAAAFPSELGASVVF